MNLEVMAPFFDKWDCAPLRELVKRFDSKLGRPQWLTLIEEVRARKAA